MLTVKASNRPSPSEIPLYAWFQDEPQTLESPTDSGSQLHASVSNQVSKVVQRLVTFTSAPQPRSIGAGPADVPITTGRRQRPLPSTGLQAEVRSAYPPESQTGLAAEQGLEVKQWWWSLAVVCALALFLKDIFL